MSTVALLGGTAAPSLAQVVGTTAAEEFGEDVIFLEPDADAVPEAQSDFVEPVLPDAIPEDSQLEDEPAADEPATPPQEVTETPPYIERFNAGLAQYREGNDELAIEEFNAAIAINPEYAPAYLFRGAAFTRLDNTPAALNSYNQAISLDSNYSAAYLNRGILYYDLQN
ncbi:MAG: tetratricopeptide repeat protein, partial [Cyanobacteria bacterium J06628_4]